jgi:hypothetical protein
VIHGLGFFMSQLKNCPIQSPLTTHKGMMRTYSTPDLHGSPVSCEIVALLENFVDRPRRATICSVLKVLYFLRTVWGYISPFQYTIWPKARYQKMPKTFAYNFCTITNLKKFHFPLPRDQTSRSWIWQMISENSSVGLSIKTALDVIYL